MLIKSLCIGLFLFATCALTLTVSHEKHTVLGSAKSKAHNEPFVINLNKKERSHEEKKQFMSFLQTTNKELKSTPFASSFLQKKTVIENKTSKSIRLPLLNNMNTMYSGQIEVGSTRQRFDIVFDTGSTALFLNSKFCTNDACSTHHQFDPTLSTTLKTTDPLMNLQVEYGSGAVDGVLVSDNIYIGGLKVSDHIFFLIDDQSGVLDGASFDGVAGLSFPEGDLDGPQVVSLFDDMMDNLPNPYFSIHLRRNDEMNSYVMFGGYNEHHMASDLVWHKVISPNYWMLELDSIYVGDKATEFCKLFKCGVVIDSGTSVLTAPTYAILEMQSLLGDVSCDSISTLPDVTLEMGGQKYTMTPDEYIITMDKHDNVEFFEHSRNPVDCSGVFTPMDLQTPDEQVVFILGDTFMTKYYTVFDRKHKRIGMALQKR